MAIPTLTTPRLLLRPFTPQDAAAHHQAVYGDDEVMKYIPGGAAVAVERVHKTIAYFLDHWQQHGFGAWTVVHRADDRVIGQCGLNVLKEDNAVEVFYAIATAYWGQGLTTEAAASALDYGFTVANLAHIIGLAVPANIASRRVLEKNGMQFQGITTKYYNAMEFALYTLDR